MKRLLGFLFVLLCGPASAQQQVLPWCLPGVDNATALASSLESGITRNGVWVRWYCAEVGTGRLQAVVYVGTIAELSKVGSRVQTILKALDPLKSLQTAGQRFPILPLDDPSLASIVADMNAARPGR